MTALKLIILAIAIIAGLAYYTLYRNEANLFQSPGHVARLSVYLTSNTATTSDDHIFEELRTPVFTISAEQLYKRVIDAATKLGWEVQSHDSENQNANFVVNSPVFLFRDDVYVQVKFIDMNASALLIQSASRTGRADLAANAGHIQDLIKQVKK